MDDFAKTHLPPPELLPTFLPTPLAYPDHLNAAAFLFTEARRLDVYKNVLLRAKGRSLTYEDCDQLSSTLALHLIKEWKLEPGERVLLRGPNTAGLALAWLAVIKAGGICVTTMPLLRTHELNYIVEKVKIKHCICDDRFTDEIEAMRSTSRLPHIYYYPANTLLETVKAIEKLRDADRGLGAQTAEFAVETAASDIAIIAFTSGTTGNAKATAHTHRDLITICDCFPVSTLKAHSADIFTGTPPLGFTFGLGGLLLFPMRVGASVLLIEKPTPLELLRQMEEHRVTVLFTSPTGYRGLLEHISDCSQLCLRRCVSAGETLPRATFDAWQKHTGIKIIDGIGATELLHIFISASDDEITPGSTGKTIPHYQAMVVNERGEECPRGEIGLLAVRGPTGCRYLADIDRQKEYVRWGWNITGDAYIQDQDGYFWFQARADDMIISSGYNISGVEVENALLQHPEVKECAVVGATDPERGQIVKAFVVLKDATKAGAALAVEIQNFVKLEIAPYKYPRCVEFVKELPKTETGKLQRFKLRK